MPFYFDYQEKIFRCLKEKGANVFLINENVCEQSLWIKIISIYRKKRYGKILEEYYMKKFRPMPDMMDYILVIKGSTLDGKKIDFLKNKYPNAKFIMYQWDSVAVFPKAEKIAHYFDCCYTFDPDDAKHYGWKYRALFFDPGQCCFDYQRKIDFAYICSLHSERAKLHQELKELAEKKQLVFYDYLFTNRWSYFRQKYIKKNKNFDIKRKDVKFVSLSEKDLSNIYNQSKCLIDYKFPWQKGLTIRSIESVGHGCKLITNNELIKNEDFYDPKNIYVYNINDFDIPLDFLESGYQRVSEEIYKKYTVQGWVEEIFGNILGAN